MTDRQPRDASPQKNPTEARQGARGAPVLWVLLGGLALAVVALFYFVSTDVENPPPVPSEQQPVGPSSDATPNNAEPSRLDAPPGPAK